MAKFELKFISEFEDDFIKAEIATNYFKGLINISGLCEGREFNIYLDKSTSIKFAKTLRTEINKITALEGGQNG